MNNNKWKILVYIALGLVAIILLPIMVAGKPWGNNGYYEYSDRNGATLVILDLGHYDLSADGVVSGDLTMIEYAYANNGTAFSYPAFVKDGSLYFGINLNQIRSEIVDGKITLFSEETHKFKKVLNPLSLYYYMYIYLTCKKGF